MAANLSATSSNSEPSHGDEHEEINSIQHLLKRAEERKTDGNDFFRSGDLDDAILAYRAALDILPKRQKTRKSVAVDHEPDEDQPKAARSTGPDIGDGEKDEARSPLDLECSKLRAALYANIGACYVKQAKHNEAVEACTEALVDDPLYVKALQRRAASSEKLNTWSSLTKSQEDYSALLKLLPPSSSQYRDAERALRSLEPRIEVAQKAETAEMIDKLKGLGNSILGNFGLSTDNFKFEPNGQGGYSMGFSR